MCWIFHAFYRSRENIRIKGSVTPSVFHRITFKIVSNLHSFGEQFRERNVMSKFVIFPVQTRYCVYKHGFARVLQIPCMRRSVVSSRGNPFNFRWALQRCVDRAAGLFARQVLGTFNAHVDSQSANEFNFFFPGKLFGLDLRSARVD